LLAASVRDPEAFAVFYDLHFERVLAFFAKRVSDSDTAFDLTSETFAKALERRRQFRGASRDEEQAWLFSIARTELLHFWRDGATEHAALSRLGVEVPALADPDLERIEELASLLGDELIRDALTVLPDDQRRAVELRVFDDVDYETLAAVLEISVQTARMRVSRGLRALGMTLGPVIE
jgi:RNA polymerase sigma-70 factor (ECF subfamily)